MARKRKKLKDLDYESPEYWNRLLAEEGLTMEQGNNPKLVYVGSSDDLSVVEEYQSGDRTGRVRPKGFGPDQ